MSILDNRPALAHEIGQIAEAAGYLWQKGWAERNGGNITVNITEHADEAMRAMPAISQPIAIGSTLPNLRGCYFYCKGTQKRMGALADETGVPTSELPSHLAVHNYLIGKGSTYKASVHTHPIELVAMSHNPEFLKKDVLTKLLWSMIPETKAFAPRGLGMVPYMLPSSNELAAETIKAIDDNYDVVMWEKHGVFAVENDVMSAFDQIDVLNKSANIYMCARSMGFVPDGMSDEQMTEISTVFHLPK